MTATSSGRSGFLRFGLIITEPNSLKTCAEDEQTFVGKPFSNARALSCFRGSLTSYGIDDDIRIDQGRGPPVEAVMKVLAARIGGSSQV